MSERLTVVVDDDIPALLLELAGSSRKQGEYISALVRASFASEDVPVASHFDSLTMQVKGLIAEVKYLKSKMADFASTSVYERVSHNEADIDGILQALRKKDIDV